MLVLSLEEPWVKPCPNFMVSERNCEILSSEHGNFELPLYQQMNGLMVSHSNLAIPGCIWTRLLDPFPVDFKTLRSSHRRVCSVFWWRYLKKQTPTAQLENQFFYLLFVQKVFSLQLYEDVFGTPGAQSCRSLQAMWIGCSQHP